jgi:recombination protein RecT
MVTNQELMTMPIHDALEVIAPRLIAALPDNIPHRRFDSVIKTALNLNPDLLRCNRHTLIQACQRAAQDGLYPDGREAALVPYNGKVSYQPMIAGIRKRMMNSGLVKSANADVVYENDYFRDVRGDNPHIEHEPPSLGEDRGVMIGAYAVIHLKTGGTVRDVMSKAEIERIRDLYSKASRDDAPWKVHPAEMWKKTVLKRCSKQVPFSSEEHGWLTERADGGVIEDVSYEHVPMPEEPAPPRPTTEEIGPNGGQQRPPRQRRAAAKPPAEAPVTGDTDLDKRFPADGQTGDFEGKLPPEMEPTDDDPITLPGEQQPEVESGQEGEAEEEPEAEKQADPLHIPFTDPSKSQAWYREARARVEGMLRDPEIKAPVFRRFREVNAPALQTLRGPGTNAFRSLWKILDDAITYGVEKKK